MKYIEKDNEFKNDTGATRILLVRHGESIGNLDGMYLGHTDLGLSPLGYEQADICAEFLKDEHFDYIYASTLSRAYDTAVPHAKIRGLEVIGDDELRELFLGDWEGKTLDYLKNEQKELFYEGWINNFGTFTVPGGESVLHLAERIYKKIEALAQKHVGKSILIATHAAAIRAFWGKACEIKPENLAASYQFPLNTSVSTIYYKDGKFYPIEYSNNRHVDATKLQKIE